MSQDDAQTHEWLYLYKVHKCPQLCEKRMRAQRGLSSASSRSEALPRARPRERSSEHNIAHARNRIRLLFNLFCDTVTGSVLVGPPPPLEQTQARRACSGRPRARFFRMAVNSHGQHYRFLRVIQRTSGEDLIPPNRILFFGREEISS